MPITYGRASRVNVNLNSGGGTKKQGLKPTQTNFYIMSGTGGGNNYRTRTGGENRDMIFSVNQLSGGVGRNRGPFLTGAGGTKRFEPYKYGAKVEDVVCLTDSEKLESDLLTKELAEYYGPGFCFVGDFDKLRDALTNPQGCGENCNAQDLMSDESPVLISIPVTEADNQGLNIVNSSSSDIDSPEIIAKVNRLNELIGKGCLSINQSGNGGTCVGDLGKQKCALISFPAQLALQGCGFGIEMSSDINLPLSWSLPSSVNQSVGNIELPGFNAPMNPMKVRAYVKA